MNNDQMRKFSAELNLIVAALRGRISAAEQQHVDSYFKAGEYSLLVEALLFNVVRDRIPLSATEREQLLRFGRETKAGDEYLAPFAALKSDPENNL